MVAVDMDAYESVCSVFNKLCPQLVPKPLWGVSLAKLVRMGTDELSLLGLEPRVAGGLKSFWLALPRDKCVICGSKASDIDEFWSYHVDSGRGLARIVSLRSLCEKCHLAKHIGYANVTGRLNEALEHLARVNNSTLSDVYTHLGKIYETWESLSSITNWRVEISEGVLPGDIRAEVENALNKLLERNKWKKRNL